MHECVELLSDCNTAKIKRMLLLVPIGLLIGAWYIWIRSGGKWTKPHWKSLLAVFSLVALSLSFTIYAWAIASRKQDQLFGGVLIGRHPWPRIAACCSLISIIAALTGKRGIRALVVSAALLLEFFVLAAVMAD